MSAPAASEAARAYDPAVRYPYKATLPAPLYWPLRGVRALGVASCFALFWGGAVLACWLVLPFVWLWPGPHPQKRRRAHALMRAGFHVFHFVMRVMRLYHRRSDAAALRCDGIPASQPCVIVSNHPTLCDVTSIASRFPNIVAIARPSLANNPLMRPLVRAMGFVPVGVQMLKEAEARLRQGYDVLIFPEGTRTPFGGPLHPFHRGAFEIAQRANVPVILVKLTCTPAALTKNLPVWKHPDRTAVLTIEPFGSVSPGETSSRETARAVEQRYREALGYSAPTGGTA